MRRIQDFDRGTLSRRTKMTELGNTRRRPKPAKRVKYAFIVLGFLAAVVGAFGRYTPTATKGTSNTSPFRAEMSR